jgi:hypothetical protein
VAGEVTRLFERDDFAELVELAAGELGISPGIVEKDYYVTEALRIIAEHFGDRVLFKGGTSLSKGWKLIERFSEDIDLYVPEDRSSSRATGRRLKAIAAAIAEHPALARDETRAKVVSLGRTEYFAYSARAAALPGVEATVMLEAGVQSGEFPVEVRPIQSLLAELLDRRGIDSGAGDQTPFAMRLLHSRRTFVEKLFTLHDRVERLVRREGRPLGAYARHYFDVARLLEHEEVRRLPGTAEYAEIAADYRRLASLHFPGQVLPARMELRESPALFPGEALRRALATEYEEQCRRLCFGEFPEFEAVLGALEEVRGGLTGVSEALAGR